MQEARGLLDPLAMLQGFVTDRDLSQAEEAFPGIRRFYADLVEKPATFLELVWRYACRCDRAPKPAPAVAMTTRGAGVSR